MMEQLDWQRPWLQGWREPGQRVAQRFASGMPLDQALNAEPGVPVRFVPQSELSAGQAYEHFIFRSGQCPTRDNLHDFFNGLCWINFPETKKNSTSCKPQKSPARAFHPCAARCATRSRCSTKMRPS